MAKVIFKDKKNILSLNVSKKNKLFIVDNIEDISDIKIKDLMQSTRIVSWSDIIRKKFSLPPVEPKNLKKTIDLQLAFNYPQSKTKGLYSLNYATDKRSLEGLILGYPYLEDIPVKNVVIEQIALYALANHFSDIPENKPSLIVAYFNNILYTIALENSNEIGLIRKIVNPAKLPLEFKLSMQKSFLSNEKKMLEPEKIIIFSDNLEIDLLPDNISSKIDLIDINTILDMDTINQSKLDVFTALLCVGTSLTVNLSKPMKNWILTPAKADLGKVIKKIIPWTIPAIAILYGMWLYCDVWMLTDNIDILKSDLKKIEISFQKEQELETNVALLEDFFANVTPDLRSPQNWKNLIEAFTKSCPSGLKITRYYGELNKQIGISGETNRFETISDYMNVLKKCKFIKNLDLLSSRKQMKNNDSVKFQLTCNFELEEL